MSRRAALKLTAWGGAGLVASACTDRGRPTTPEASLRPATPEPAPLPGRPPNVRVSQDQFVAHAEPCLAVNPRDPRNLLGACIAHEDGGGRTSAPTPPSMPVRAGAAWVAWRTRRTAATPPSPSTPPAAATSAPTPTTSTSGGPMTAAAPLPHRCWPPRGTSWTTRGWPPTRPLDRRQRPTCMAPGPGRTTPSWNSAGPATAAAASRPRARSTPCGGRTRRTSPPPWSRPGMAAPSTPSTACGRRFRRSCRGRSSTPRSGSSPPPTAARPGASRSSWGPG
jgi:hypothetical protein